MYKILICDDEKIVIDSLKYVIQKSFGNECIVEIGRTGRDLIELADSFRPDIAIVDIQMPGINGIDAMKEIVKRNQTIVFIVITAFDKFEYAKESANLGVLKFLNKPVNQTVVADTIRSAMNKIKQDRDKRSFDLEIKEKLENVIPIIENGFIYSLLLESDSVGEINQYKELLELAAEYGYFMVIEWGELREGYHLGNAIGASIKAQSFYRELREYIKEFFSGYIGAITSNKVTVYVPTTIAGTDYNMRISIIENARALVRKLMQRIDYDFRIGIGTIKPLSYAVDSYHEAIRALKYEKGKVAHVEDIEVVNEIMDHYPIEKEKELLESIKKSNLNKTRDLATELFQWLQNCYGDKEEGIKFKVLEIILVAEKMAIDNGKMIQDTMERSKYLEIVANVPTQDYLLKWFLEKLEEVSRNMAIVDTAQINETIGKALEYLHENYKKYVTLDEVSRFVNISPYYFSKIFKEEVGFNFIDYLTRIRMEKAKQLLNNKELSVKEICLEVGYNDPNYFSRLFKKQEGITPTDFREN